MALLLLLGAGAPPRAAARPLEYFDTQSRQLALPDPPGLTFGPISNSSLRETRDVTVLSDGASSAAPMQAWDLALLRMFHVAEGQPHHAFLALVNIEDERIFHLDLGATTGDLIRRRIISGGAAACNACSWCV